LGAKGVDYARFFTAKADEGRLIEEIEQHIAQQPKKIFAAAYLLLRRGGRPC